MISTDQQLTEIALACGFADQPHLNRSFRRVVGMSPGLWRRRSAEIDGGASAGVGWAGYRGSINGARG